jgi:predicted RNase H-like nuclease
MAHKKTTTEGKAERISLLAPIFPKIERHIDSRPSGVGKDDLLDAAAAAWTALRRHRGEAICVSTSERDEKGLAATIYY